MAKAHRKLFSVAPVPVDRLWWEPEGGSLSGSEREGGDQPRAENSASSGSRSTPLNDPTKRSKKVRLKEEGRQEKKCKKREKNKTKPRNQLLLSRQELSSGVNFFGACFSSQEKPLQKHKVWAWEMWSYRCLKQAPGDSLLIHAVQCNGTWVIPIVFFSFLPNTVINALCVEAVRLETACPVLAGRRARSEGGGEKKKSKRTWRQVDRFV